MPHAVREAVIEWLMTQPRGEGRSAAEIHRAVQKQGFELDYIALKRAIGMLVLNGTLERIRHTGRSYCLASSAFQELTETGKAVD